MKPLPIVWKRLLKDGATCDRCGDTGQELDAAVATLAAALRPLGIEPVLDKQAIEEAAFKDEPSESNRVWIAGKPIEEWLGANVGMSRCCSVCGDSDCRTLEVGGQIWETLPQDQIVKAGLLAASQMIAPAPQPSSCGCGDAGAETSPPAPERSKSRCCG